MIVWRRFNTLCAVARRAQRQTGAAALNNRPHAERVWPKLRAMNAFTVIRAGTTGKEKGGESPDANEPRCRLLSSATLFAVTGSVNRKIPVKEP